MSLCHINARSLTATNRIAEIEDFVSVLNDFDIVGVSETHLNATITDSIVSISQYSILRSDRNRRGGGVCLYIKDHITHHRKFDLESNNTESVWAEVHIGNYTLLVESSLFWVLNDPTYWGGLSVIKNSAKFGNAGCIPM